LFEHQDIARKLAVGFAALATLTGTGAPASAQPAPAPAAATAGGAQAVPVALCTDLAARLNKMTASQVGLMTTVPASARVASRCALELREDVVAGQKCVTDVCTEVDGDGIVVRTAGNLDDRLSSCARTTIDLVRLNRSFDLLTISFGKICGRIPAAR